MFGTLVLLAIGAGVGYAAWAYLRLDVSQTTAIAAGAIGALVFGTLIKLLAGLVFSLMVAALGAAGLVYLASEYQKRRRR